MDAKTYDTRLGILAALEDRSGAAFLSLCAERNLTNVRGEQLHDWTVGGLYWLTKSGDVKRRIYCEQRFDWIVSEGVATGAWAEADLPNIGETCHRCGKGWELADLHTYRHSDVGMHEQCKVFAAHDRAQRDVLRMLRQAGQEDISPIAVPNLSGTQNTEGPWFTFVHPSVGRVTLGVSHEHYRIEWERGPKGLDFSGEHVFNSSHSERRVSVLTIRTGAKVLARIFGAT